jgi:hypothetical protein
MTIITRKNAAPVSETVQAIVIGAALSGYAVWFLISGVAGLA